MSNKIRIIGSAGKRLAQVPGTMNMNTTTLTVGDPAPDFSAIAVGAEFAEGKPFRLSDYFHEQIVLYFYPQPDEFSGEAGGLPK